MSRRAGWNDALALPGSSAEVGVAAGNDDGDDGVGKSVLAPASVERVQTAVLVALQRLCCDARAAPTLAGAPLWEACVAAVSLLADARPLALREAASAMLAAAAGVDADAVGLLLADVAAVAQGPAAAAALLAVAGPQAQDEDCGAFVARTNATAEAAVRAALADTSSTPVTRPALPALPRPGVLLPPVSAAAAAAAEAAAPGCAASSLARLLRSGEAVSCARRATALLSRVQSAPKVEWHARAASQLALLQREGSTVL